MSHEVQITVTPVRCTLKGPLDRKLVKFIRDTLSYYVEGYRFTSAFKAHAWDGKKAFFRYDFKKQTGTSAAGLSEYIYQILDKAQVPYQIIDKRKYPDLTNPLSVHGKILRDYQQEGVDLFLEHKWIIWQAATGAGKTVMIAGAVAETNIPTMIYVTTKDLLNQMYNELTAMLQVPIGRIGAGYTDIQKINVCTVQTCHKALGTKYIKYDTGEEKDRTDIAHVKQEIVRCIQQAQMLVIDEVHHLVSSTIQNIARRSKNAVYRIGASATPFREKGDDLAIEAELGAALFSVSASYLIEKKWLVPPTIQYMNVPAMDMEAKKYASVYKEYIVENTIRNKMVVDNAKAMVDAGRKILILISHRDNHGKVLQEMLEPHMAIKFLHGRVKDSERVEILQEIKDGKIDCVLATSLADEGLDLPIVSGLIPAGGQKSRVKVLQRVGRTLRTHDGKKDALIIDFIDNVKYLKDHSYERIRVLKTESAFKIKVPADKIEEIKYYIENKESLKKKSILTRVEYD